MTEKLKVNKLVGAGLKDLLSRNREDYSFEFIITTHAAVKAGTRAGWNGSKEWDSLNSLTLPEMAQAVYVGYEIEETKEEKILMLYDKYNTDIYIYSGNTIKTVIKEVLNILEINIKDVNAVKSNLPIKE